MENDTRTEGTWLIRYKKATGKPRIEYEAQVEELEIPGDLRLALADDPSASANFDAFPRSVKRGILDRHRDFYDRCRRSH